MFTGFVASTIFTFSLTFLPATPQATSSGELYPDIIQDRSYTVKKDDSLESIARENYGDKKYWEFLWADNNWIENPSYIEIGWKIRLRQKVIEKDLDTIKLPERETRPLAHVQSAQYTYEPSPVPAQQTQATSSASGPLNDAQITFLGTCESGMRPAINTGNGYYGAFQFTIGTWNSMGTGYARADLAPLEVQKVAVQRLLSRSSINTQFPGCAAKMRNAGLI